MCMIVHDCTSMYSYRQVWSIDYFRAGKAHLTQVHSANPALSLLFTASTCFRTHFNSVAVNPVRQYCTFAKFCLVLVAVCKSNTGMALGTLKFCSCSRKAGGRCIQCSFCVELFVHGKRPLKPEVAYTRFYSTYAQ